jgi:hypothetical protein
VSRNGVDHTRRFPDLAAAIAKLTGRTLVLDGEVAIYDQQLRSRFDWLREPDPDAALVHLKQGAKLAEAEQYGLPLARTMFFGVTAQAALGEYEEALRWYRRLHDYAFAAVRQILSGSGAEPRRRDPSRAIRL